MEKKHKEALRSKRVFLVENVDPATIINHLIQEGLINDDESEEIEALTRRKEKVRRIVQKVQLRGPTAFDKFVKVLDDTGASFVADELRATAKEKANVLEGVGVAAPPHEFFNERYIISSDRSHSCSAPVSKSSVAASPADRRLVAYRRFGAEIRAIGSSRN